MRDVMKYSAEAFAERMLLEGDLQGNRIVLQLLQQRDELRSVLAKVERLAKWDQNDLPEADSGMQQIWRDGYERAIENLREALKSENYITKAEAA